MKIKHTDIEQVRAAINKTQGNLCMICDEPIKTGSAKKRPALDHCHRTGWIRGVLCIWCNACLGRVENASRSAVGKNGDLLKWLLSAINYLETHKQPQWSIPGKRLGLMHPTFKTPEDKRLKRLSKAVAKRQRARALKMLKG